MTDRTDRPIRHRLFVTTRVAVALAIAAAAVAALPAVLAVVLAGAGIGVLIALVVADARRAARASDIRCERTVPVKLSIGVPNPVDVRLVNTSGQRARLSLRETPPVGFSGEREVRLVEVPPHGEVQITFHFTPPRRGGYRFGPVALRCIGGLGLAGWQWQAPLDQDVRVYPDIMAVSRYALLARRGALRELGIRALRRAGEGTEFESLRDYLPGDDYGDIDWKATSRRGTPVTRLYEVERSQVVVLAIDVGRMMTAMAGPLSKLDRAVNAALLLCYLAIEHGDLVGLLVFGRDVVRYVPPRKGQRQFHAILEALYSVEARVEEPDYAGAMAYLTSRLGRRALIVLMTDIVGRGPSERLLKVVGALVPRHLPLVICQRNRLTEVEASASVDDEISAFRVAVAQDLLRDKAEALAILGARGSLILDVHPEELSVAAVNRYLEIKARGRL
ncbi:MAG: DUF58 domain-containing protein [Coriobacteriia bacterium]|nr:DUF58 domain-containing protein [Coriobacteriia bacterium]